MRGITQKSIVVGLVALSALLALAPIHRKDECRGVLKG